jgi:hypothetical protein
MAMQITQKNLLSNFASQKRDFARECGRISPLFRHSRLLKNVPGVPR